MELKLIKRKHKSFNVKDRKVVLRLFEIQQYMYGVTFAIRNPEDKGVFDEIKENQIVKQILNGREKKRIFLKKYRHFSDKRQPEEIAELGFIVSNIMDWRQAETFLNSLAEHMKENFQEYVPFKI